MGQITSKPNAFQSTLPRGERPTFVPLAVPSSMFQSTLPRGERREAFMTWRDDAECSNPRSRAGSDNCRTAQPSPPSAFQSTLPRGERRPPPRRQCRPAQVPIHAPARGTTQSLPQVPTLEQVPIHAPARGATPTCQWVSGGVGQFQSTLPRGERRLARRGVPHSGCSNPRSRAGSDRDYGAQMDLAIMFQSTLPRGERHKGLIRDGHGENVPIHAPARGATRIEDVFQHALYALFQSTLPRGERRRRIKSLS